MQKPLSSQNLFTQVISPPALSDEWYINFLDKDQEILLEMTLAANYLDIPSLV